MVVVFIATSLSNVEHLVVATLSEIFAESQKQLWLWPMAVLVSLNVVAAIVALSVLFVGNCGVVGVNCDGHNFVHLLC